MIKVKVIAFATLRRHLPDLAIGEEKILSVEPGTTLDEIRDMLHLPEEEVKVIMRNNIQANPKDIAEDGDRIAFIPAVAGG
jgi:molybdopterin converting factor small subunit